MSVGAVVAVDPAIARSAGAAFLPHPLAPCETPFDASANVVAGMQDAVYTRRPHLQDTVDTYGNYTLGEYSALVTEGYVPHEVYAERKELLAAVLRRTSPDTAAYTLDRYTANTTGHFSVTGDPVEISAQVMYALGGLLDGSAVVAPYYGTGHVPGFNMWNVRGGVSLSHTDDQGRRIRLPLFPGSLAVDVGTPAARKLDMDKRVISMYPRYDRMHITAMLDGSVNRLTSEGNPLT